MAAPPKIRYTLGWKDPHEQLFDIEISFRSNVREAELRLPSWRPGRYLIQNYAANVRSWEARNAAGRVLPMEKIDKSTWLVKTRPGEKLSVKYQFFAGVLNAGSSFLSPEEAYFNGSNLFMMIADQREDPALLELQVPDGWSVETQLEGHGKNSWYARDYDYLIDSPTIISPSLRVETFTEAGCQVRLVFQGGEGIDTAQFTEPVKRIVRAHAKLFDGIPAKQYRFLYHFADLWHGVEHEDSCSIALKRDEMLGAREGSEAFDHFLAITSHEFFHLWNVKRIMPAVFAPYDYSKESYTRLLWVMEGVTSYYGEKMLLLSGLWSRERYLDHLSTEINTLEASAGKRFLSVAQASFDAWLQEPAQMHDKARAWISFYNKGEIVAALLDLEMRKVTGGRRSLDDLMRQLWTRYARKSRGLDEDAIRKAVTSVTGKDLSSFFDRFVDGVDPLPYADQFAVAGVEVQTVESAGGKLRGVTLQPGARLLVSSTEAGSELKVLDEIVALGDRRVLSEAAMGKMLSALPASAGSAELTIARDGRLVRVNVPIDRIVSSRLRLSIAATRSETQDQLLNQWLGESVGS